MTLKEVVFLETLSLLTEEKVSSFVSSIINRYDSNGWQASRIQAVANSKYDIDRRLYNDDPNKPISKNKFRDLCIIEFRKEIKNKKVAIKEYEFITLMDSYLSHFDVSGKFIPLEK